MADNTNVKKLTYDDYTVGIICPLEVEMTALRYMLDEEHVRLPGKDGDRNRYILGKMGDHNVVIGYLPQGSQGIGAAATVATDMRRTFSSVQLRLLVGIGGGIPSKENDIRLGDVVVGMPDGIHGGVVQYDLGKRTVDGFERKGFLCPPPDEWRTAVVEMKSDHEAKPNKIAEFVSQMLGAFPKLQKYSRPATDQDLLFPPDTKHVRDEPTCDQCDKSQPFPPRGPIGPEIFYGTIASGDSVIKDAEIFALKEPSPTPPLSPARTRYHSNHTSVRMPNRGHCAWRGQNGDNCTGGVAVTRGIRRKALTEMSGNARPNRVRKRSKLTQFGCKLCGVYLCRPKGCHAKFHANI